MRTVDFMAKVEWQVLESYGLHRTNNRHIDCPICERKKKFRLHEHNGRATWICTCGHGGAIDLIMEVTGMDFKTLADKIDREYGNDSSADITPKPKPQVRLQTFERLDGTHIQDYLKSRGINVLPKMNIRLARNQYHSDELGNMDTMHAIATDYAMNEAYVHRTFIYEGKKIDGYTSRKLEKIRETQNVAVKMFPQGKCLGVAEGIESGLSAHQIYKVPVWATLNTSLMKKFRAPKGVSVLNIYADNDSHGAGLAAAFECGHRNVLCGNDVTKVIIKWPEAGDFNNHLQNPGKIFEWELTK